MRKKIPIFYSALLLTGVNLFLRLVSTGFQVFLSRKIGPSGIGLLQLVMSTGALAMTAGMAGIRTATMYLAAEELGTKRSYNITWVLSACLLYSILCSGVISLLLSFSAPWISVNWIGNPETEGAIRLYACFIPVICLCGVMIGYFTAANRIGTLAAVEIGEQFVYIAVSVSILSFWAGTDTARACQSLILASGISSCITLSVLVMLRLRENAKTGAPIPIRKRLLHAAVPLALADNLRTGISTTENLMVPRRLALYPGTENPLAVFGTVCGMVFPILMFPASILFGLAELLIPELARCAAAKSSARVHYLVKRGLRVAILYGCLCSGMEFLLADWICLRLYKNADAGIYLKLYALLIPMLYCDTVTDAMTKGLGQQKACVKYNIITSAMDVAFLYILLPRFGMTGYYVSFLVTHLLNMILSLRRLLALSGNALPIKTPLLAGLCTACALWLANFLPSLGLQTVAFVTIWVCLLMITETIGAEDILWIQGLIQGSSPHNTRQKHNYPTPF